MHLFGQSADMEKIMAIAAKHDLIVIEDNAQAIGSELMMGENRKVKTGAIGHVATTSFYPTKTLVHMVMAAHFLQMMIISPKN